MAWWNDLLNSIFPPAYRAPVPPATSTSLAVPQPSFLDIILGAPKRTPILTRPTNISQYGVDMIARHEQFSAQAYRDAAGHWTIGYGHKIVWGDGLSNAMTLSEPQARAILSRDLQVAVNCVRGRVSAYLTQAQFDALVSLAFNIGCGAFSGSTLLKLVNAGQFNLAAQEFPKWIYANGQVAYGLVSRRTEEQQLFLA